MEFYGKIKPYKCLATGALKVPIEVDTHKRVHELFKGFHNFQGKVLDLDIAGLLTVQCEYSQFTNNHNGNFEIPFELYYQEESRVVGPIARLKNNNELVKFVLTVLDKEQREERQEGIRKKQVSQLHALFRELDRKSGYHDGYYKEVWKISEGIQSIAKMNTVQLSWAIELLTSEVMSLKEK